METVRIGKRSGHRQVLIRHNDVEVRIPANVITSIGPS
jgi:hypothetical protein